MHTLYVAHSMSTWAVPSAGTGLAHMSLHVSRARLHESLSSADYLLGKCKVNKQKVRIMTPAHLRAACGRRAQPSPHENASAPHGMGMGLGDAALAPQPAAAAECGL